MRVAICYPPLKSEKGVPLLTQNRQFQWFSRPTYIFPVVPATAATMLKKAGHEVLFLDGIAGEMTEAEFDARLAEFKPELVVLETKTPVVKRHWRWLEKIASSAVQPSTSNLQPPKVVMVGDHVTAMPEESLAKPGVWAIIPGGDWDYGLVDYIAAGCPKGLQPFALRESLKDLPWIDRDLVHWELYAKRNGNFLRTPGTYIMAGRDCWHAKCTFCSWTTLYPRYRVRDVKDVVDEIEMLVTKYGVKEIMDDSGSFPVGGWLTEFCNEMIRRGLNKKLRLDCNMRFGRLTFDDYKLMRKAGFRLVLFGVESANQATLDRFVKALKVEDVEKGAAWASKAGLAVHLTFMFGHAWEGPAEIENTVRLARKLLANGHAATLQCTLTIPYPGTPLFKELAANGGLNTLDWDEYDQRRAITKTPLVTEAQTKCAIRRVYRGFLQPRALLHIVRRNLFDFGFYYRGFRYLMGHLLDFKTVALVAAATLACSGFAEKVKYEHYQTIVDRQMFGPLPPNFDPTKSPSEVQAMSKAEQQQLTQEQEKLKSAIHFSVINVGSDGMTVVGFTDKSDAKSPKHYYLKEGEEKDGWKVLEANAETATMKIVKDGIEVTLVIGGDSAKGAGSTARAGGNAPAAGAQAAGRPGNSLIGGLRGRRAERRRLEMEEKAKREQQLKQLQEEAAQRAAREQEDKAKQAERDRVAKEERDQQRAQLLEIQKQLKAAREQAAKKSDSKDSENEDN